MIKINIENVSVRAAAYTVLAVAGFALAVLTLGFIVTTVSRDTWAHIFVVAWLAFMIGLLYSCIRDHLVAKRSTADNKITTRT